jgi:uncharacterized damage-inducible protein DinB
VKLCAELARSAVRVFAANEGMNQLLLNALDDAGDNALDPAVWTEQPPGKVRPIAAIFTHLHNVRAKWIRLSAPHLKAPHRLARAHCTIAQAHAALAESAARCTEMLAQALDGSGRVPHFLRDGWAKPWPAGLDMLAYMLTHEAHHRGQVCLLAHQLGHPLPGRVTSQLWNWEKQRYNPRKAQDSPAARPS